MHYFLVRLRNIDFFFNGLCVRPPFISSAEMMWVCGWLRNKWCLGNNPTQISGAALLPPVPGSEAKSLCLSQHLICFLTWTQKKKKGQALTLQVSAMCGNKLKADGGSVRRKNSLSLCVLVKTKTWPDSKLVLFATSTGSPWSPHWEVLGVFCSKCISRANSQQLVQPTIAWKPPPRRSDVPYEKGLQSRYLERKISLL